MTPDPHLTEVSVYSLKSFHVTVSPRPSPGEVQYGGRVTDDLDKCLLNTFTRVWFSENTFSDKFCFYKGYSVPAKVKTVQDVLQHIEALPLVDSPEVSGGAQRDGRPGSHLFC